MKEQQNAVIVELRGKTAAALTDAGSFVRVQNEDYEIGQTILLPNAALRTRKRARITAFASMAAGFLLLLLGGFTGYVAPVGVVSLDVNPSIEYSINCFDRVLSITAVNDDAGTILSSMDEQALLYRSVDEAVEATIVSLRENGYLAEVTDNDVMISASSYSAQHAAVLAQRLSVRVGLQSDLTVYSVSVSSSEVESAHTLGTSAGKLYLIEKLSESSGDDESFDPADWVEKPVREIIAETKGKPSGLTDSDNAGDLPQRSPAPEQENGMISSSPSLPAQSGTQGGETLPGAQSDGSAGQKEDKGTGGSGDKHAP